jgi:hypothetical protein
MAKKSKPAASKPRTPTTAEEHRKAAELLQARARLHHAKADMADAQNPPKKNNRGGNYGRPY